jgi:tRNA modification GTPase
MTAPSYGDESPIVALATPPAESALALIRCSGTGTLHLLAYVFSAPARLHRAAAYSIVHGWIVAGGNKIDEVLVSIFHSPHSYTGEESAEISCHGGRATVAALLAALRGAGFRDALRGEFTFRAFMNGKLDLTRAESVMELVSAKTDQARDRAVRRLAGALEQDIRRIRDGIAQVLAGVELVLDYPEDELDDTAEEVPDRAGITGALNDLARLSASFHHERLYQDGVLVVIAGRPNAGKSSLFNRLLKEDRSIVTDVPGTTRDWIEACIAIEGIPVRLADTAGLRTGADTLEQIGIDRSRELIASADAVIYVIDGIQGLTPEDTDFMCTTDKPIVSVWNKADTVPAPAPFMAISAHTGAGIAELSNALAQAVHCPPPALDSSPGIASERQKLLIDRAMGSLEDCLDRADQGQTLDLLAPPLRDALDDLGTITGEVSTAEVLDLMFSRFCVGK